MVVKFTRIVFSAQKNVIAYLSFLCIYRKITGLFIIVGWACQMHTYAQHIACEQNEMLFFAGKSSVTTNWNPQKVNA